MIRLTGSNKLQVVLSGAATASRVTVSYLDFSATATSGDNQLSVTNGATPVDICNAPAAATTRQVDFISLTALAAMTPTFSINDGSARELFTAVLALGDTVYYTHAQGWKIVDSSGQLRFVMPGYLPLTGGVLTGGLTGTTLDLSGALTYGGVTLTAAVTGTGNMVLSASPTFTGTITAAALTLSSTLTLSGTAANIATGANFISYGGTDAGLSFDSSNNATLSGNLVVSGVGSHAVGGGTNARTQFILTGAFTGDIATYGFRVASSLTVPAAADGAGLLIDATLIEASSGVHGRLAGLVVSPSFTNGAATLTLAAAISMDAFAAPTGTTDACNIDFATALPTAATNNGFMRFPADATDPTGGGGAAAGRVQVVIAGVGVKYLAYY